MHFFCGSVNVRQMPGNDGVAQLTIWQNNSRGCPIVYLSLFLLPYEITSIFANSLWWRRRKIFLLVTICDSLLLSYSSGQGILVCHKQKEKLNEFAIKIIKLYTASQLLRDNTKHAQGTKVTLAVIVFSVLIISVFFSNPLFKSYPTLKLPLSIGGAVIFFWPVLFLEGYQ